MCCFIYVFFLCRAPEVLKDLAPGSQPPFLIYNEEVRTDTNKIEEFLEETLAPPQWVWIHDWSKDVKHFASQIQWCITFKSNALQYCVTP